MAFGYFVENIPDLRRLALDHLLRATNCMDIAELFEAANDERLKQDERHLLW
jgi:hypothetical protein